MTELNYYEEEKFEFPVAVVPAEFQWGVELVRLHQPSWQDNQIRGVWSLPSGVEDHLSNFSQRINERFELYGSDPAKILSSLQLEICSNYS